MRPIQTRSIGGLYVSSLPDTPAGRVLGKKEWRRSQVLDAVRRNGPLSRVDVSRIVGFNTQTISRLVDELVEEGLLIEQPITKSMIGRPPTPIVLNENACCVLGIDISQYITTALFMNLAGTVLARFEASTSEVRDSGNLAAHIGGFAAQLAHEDHPPLAGIGVALWDYTAFEPGPTGPILSSDAETIRRELEDLFHVPVIVQDDSLMLALGELWFGREKDLKDFAAVNITHGLGAGFVIDGRVYNGSRGYVGDLGHIQLGEPGVQCVCGCDACLDNLASGSGLIRLAKNAGLLYDGHPPGVDELAAMARNGSTEAQEIFARFGKALALGIGTVITLMGPETVILSGRISRFSDLFMDCLRRELPKRLVRSYLKATRVVVSELHENAVSLGTGACVLNQIFGFSNIPAERIMKGFL